MNLVRKSLGAAALVGLAGLALAAGAAKPAHKSKDVVWPAEAIKWMDGPAKGTHVAALWGDMKKGGPYGMLVRFDAGLMHPLHWHSQTLKLVLLSGTYVYRPDGGEETKLGPGSYLLEAARSRHISGCAPGADCEFFMTSGDKFDMTMVNAAPAAAPSADGAPAPMPSAAPAEKK